MDASVPLDRPKHPNDKRSLPKRPSAGADQLPELDSAETDLDERRAAEKRARI